MRMAQMRELERQADVIEQNAKQILVSKLMKGSVEVKFTKKDGTLRIMKCTKCKELIPFLNQSKTKRVYNNPNLIQVWDLDKLSWRSFDFNSIIKK